MKAAIVRRPGVLTVEDVPPPIVGEYDALCELLFGATCVGTDSHLIAGRFPWPVNYPTILGHESIGRVVKIGAKVRHLKIGDTVTRVGTPPPPDTDLAVHWGGFAELGIAKDHWAMSEDGLPREAWSTHRVNQIVPPDINPAAATMLITWRETFSFFSRMGMKPNARVLVIGSGANGLSFVAHAAILGASQIVMVGTAPREKVARAAGATEYFDYKTDDVAGVLKTEFPDGFDIIIDALGKAGTLDTFLPLACDGGTVAIYGLDDFHQLSVNPTRARGSFTYFSGGYDEAEVHERVVSLMRDGVLDASLWLDLEHPFELENINAAYEAVQSRSMMKAVVRLSK